MSDDAERAVRGDLEPPETETGGRSGEDDQPQEAAGGKSGGRRTWDLLRKVEWLNCFWLIYLSYRFTENLWIHRARYVASWNALVPCEGTDCVVALSSFLYSFDINSFAVYLLLFLLCEGVAVLRLILLVAGCVLFPILGHYLLPTRYCLAFMTAAFLAFFWSGTPKPGTTYLVTTGLSVALMLARLLAARGRFAPEESVRAILLGFLIKKRVRTAQPDA